ncbi:Major facilitator superfamily (MFS) profile domain-containing protein [Plasmodiophora brassicae]|uniref:Major facilitator superfamily (MFS) profile domain-containing protein n=1 Tax=Plasmodiophora brassicae TaxID=37360 RepID=A0A0G4IR18_PLABS|nr:hypothetical protein PBRA_005932 [Plasmodiophora brassicae]SPQ98366.1 unnamed protein product [Plasmodiophora brassicae]
MAPVGAGRVHWLVNAVMFTVGFQFVLIMSLVAPLVEQCLAQTYGSAYMLAHKGRYASALVAASYMANAFANPIWGHVADRSGRRPVMLTSLFGAALAMAVFAVSAKSYWLLLAARLLSGLTDASMFMSKAVLGDVCNAETQSKRFSEMYMYFALSLTIAPFGVSLFADNGDLYALAPCAIASAITFIVLIVCFVFLPETRPSSDAVTSDAQASSWAQIVQDRRIAASVGLYAFLAILLLGIEVLTTLIINEAPSRGGLGLGRQAIGQLFAIQGAVYIVAQRFVCPFAISRLGSVSAFRYGASSLVVIYPLAIVPSWLPLPFMFMAVQMSLKIVAISVALTASAVLINEATSPACRSSVNGLAQSLAAIARCIGAFTVGSLYDLSAASHAVYAPFLLLSLGMLIAYLASFWVTRAAKDVQNDFELD